jgi:5-methylcytosine-specific restriction endonuclease McrA
VAYARTLLLNSTYEPLRVIAWQRAVTMLYLGKVEVVESYETVLRALAVTLRMPSVIRLRRFVRRRRVRIALSRRNVFFRDGHQCQYCGTNLPLRELTCDHVTPRSQGGGSSWENLVTACGPCNRRKGGRTPEQARMELYRKPGPPEYLPVMPSVEIGAANLPARWRLYLSGGTQIQPSSANGSPAPGISQPSRAHKKAV